MPICITWEDASQRGQTEIVEIVGTKVWSDVELNVNLWTYSPVSSSQRRMDIWRNVLAIVM